MKYLLLEESPMRDSVYIILLMFSLFLPFSAEAANRILHYKPEVVALKGIVEVQTFPGPPNYESIKAGDKIEKAWILRLDEPFDIVTTQQDQEPNAELENNVKVIHLAIDNDAIWPKLKVGKHVLVKGSFYHRFNGHHHARVLLETQSLDEVK